MSDALYRELILEEYKHPQNKGRVENPSCERREYNPLCGDEITVTMTIADDAIADIKFDGKGCALSQAAASLFTEHIKGKTLADVTAMDERTMLELISVTPNPMRMKCAVLVMKAVANALEKRT